MFQQRKSCMKRPSACVATTFFFLSRQTYKIKLPLSLLESVQLGQFDLLADNFDGRFGEIIVTFPNQPTISTWKISHQCHLSSRQSWTQRLASTIPFFDQQCYKYNNLQKNAQASSILAAHRQGYRLTTLWEMVGYSYDPVYVQLNQKCAEKFPQPPWEVRTPMHWYICFGFCLSSLLTSQPKSIRIISKSKKDMETRKLVAISHDGSMEVVYLPTWIVDFYGINVGKYT